MGAGGGGGRDGKSRSRHDLSGASDEMFRAPPPALPARPQRRMGVGSRSDRHPSVPRVRFKRPHLCSPRVRVWLGRLRTVQNVGLAGAPGRKRGGVSPARFVGCRREAQARKSGQDPAAVGIIGGAEVELGGEFPSVDQDFVGALTEPIVGDRFGAAEVGHADGGAEGVGVGTAGGITDANAVAEHGFGAPEHRVGILQDQDAEPFSEPDFLLSEEGVAADERFGPVEGETQTGFEWGFVGGKLGAEGAVAFFETERVDGVVACVGQAEVTAGLDQGVEGGEGLVGGEV